MTSPRDSRAHRGEVTPPTAKKPRMVCAGWLLCLCCSLICATAEGAAPVTLSFDVAKPGANPFAREISADVRTPSGREVRLPAFYVGGNRFAVRARAEELGVYRLGKIVEPHGRKTREVAGHAVEANGVEVRELEKQRAVTIQRERPGRFVFPDGQRYVPIGMNLAWAPEGGPAWYAQALERCGREQLNWVRIWMSSWGGLNLDWREKDVRSPEPGRLDPEVAARWDELVDEAERAGVYLQIVLQHHGQYSSEVNPNWDTNPWNARNPGGFLKSPAAFFVSEKARQLTKQKYRYIVARWGYSPAVLAWELFNEVHWVDAYRLRHDVAAVAAWHDEMAAYLRSIDVYRHLVATSTDDVASPIYRSMDFYQPHLYSTNMLAAVRRYNLTPAHEDRPVFYGEVGNDHMRVTAEQKAAAVEHVPLVWASIVGEGQLPAQIWEGDKLFARDRVSELGAVARFVRTTRIAELDDLKSFAPRIVSTSSMPLRVKGSETWRKREVLTVAVAMDGRQLAEYGVVPRYLVPESRHRKDGFPDRVTFEVDLPYSVNGTLRLSGAGPKGATVEVSVDGTTAGTHTWPAQLAGDKVPPGRRPASLSFSIPAGKHSVQIRNTGREDWIDFEEIDFETSVPILAAAGKRGEDFIALWLWNQLDVFAIQTPPTVSGTVVLDDVPGGRWNVTWWNTETGTESGTTVVEHAGGELRLPVPPVERHAAVVLTRA